MRIIGNNPAADNAEITAVASGTLPSGQPVIVNSDGTVSVVGVQSGGFSVVGSTFSPSTGTGSSPIIQFDPTDGSKFVYVYRDAANSNYGTAVIGQISGSTITFGVPVVFLIGYFASANEAVGYSADGTKVVINIRDFGNSNYGSIIAASVSGTTLTFGSASVYQSNTTYSPTLSCDPFDSTKFVFTYRNQASGSIGQARVGTLSGTSVSYGSAVTFNNATTYDTAIAHNPNEQNKFMLVWNDSTQFSGSIGTVSGTSISFGSETTIASNQVGALGISFDPSSTSDKAVAVMEDTTNNKGKVVVCSISGSTITVGSTVEFYSSKPDYVGIAFSKVNDNQFYVAYRTTPSPYQARCVVGTLSGTTCSFANDTPVSSGNSFHTTVATSVSGEILFGYRDNDSTTRGVIAICSDESTTLTSENYIGMANGAAADGGKAKVDIGCGINGAQSGLTAGQTYYVQTDGTLGLTAADPSVIAGTAISATEIIVKG